MAKTAMFALVIVGFGFAMARAEEPKPSKAPSAKFSFYIDGLHCPPCTKTVENSLKKNKGIQSVQVDFGTKMATVQVDEAAMPVQRLAKAIDNTPHMMGAKMQYRSMMTLKIPDLKDDASAKTARESLQSVGGVQKVTVDAKKQTAWIEFAPQGNTTSQSLLEALSKSGLKGQP